jgi:hypothetical protein
VCEEHLLGAFWTAVRLLLRHEREGRRNLRVGSRQRVEFDAIVARESAEELSPEDVVESRDRAARAADFVAQLSEFERQVVAVMAVRGLGAKLTARALGAPVRDVRAAERSAQGKLDRVAVIAAAGRMCDYRGEAILAYARGSVGGEDERLARAHLTACAACRSSYARMVREMRTRGFQRGTVAAFLPVPIISFGPHLGGVGRLLGYGVDRVVPGGGAGERAVEVLGGAGVVKAAATGGAMLVATATLATSIPTLVAPSAHQGRRVQHHHRVLASRASTTIEASTVPASAAATSSKTLAGSSIAPTGRRASMFQHLTSNQHAELEFGLSRARPTHTSASRERVSSTASVASARTSSVTSGSRAEPTEAGESPTTESKSGTVASSSGSSGGEASQAAREFGQP